MRVYLLALAVLLAACGDDDDDDDSTADATADASGDSSSADGGGDASTDGSDVDASPNDSGQVVVLDGAVEIDGGGTCYRIVCDGHETQCGDCTDNDGDGIVDSNDGDCLGPCDNTEGPGFLAGIGGESGGPCKSDCYFDFGNGSGGGDCEWDHRCDPLQSEANGYNPEGEACEYEESDSRRDQLCPIDRVTSSSCQDTCGPLTPNGCDCFGCCAFPELEGRSAAEGGEYVWLGSVFEGTNDASCTAEDIDDPTLCRPCTPVGECFNDCGECELCVGKDTIPDYCTSSPPDGGTPDAAVPDGGTPDATVPDAGTPDATVPDGGTPPARCESGVQACGLASDPPCPTSAYCITGCCQVFF